MSQDRAGFESGTPRSEKVEYLAAELKIPKHEADRLLANMEAQ